MALQNVYVPYGAYFSSAFCRWQGSIAEQHSVKLVAATAKAWLERKGIAAETFDGLDLGVTIPQADAFYGAPWVAAMLGAPALTGATIAQACATSTKLLWHGALQVESGTRSCQLALACDRTSNGPHIYFPSASAPGGRGQSTDWVWDAFNRDPHAKLAMIETAENVAKEAGISKEQQDEVTLLRYEQYEQALADDRAFQRRYMAPIVLKKRKKETLVDADEGVFPTTAEGLAKLRPVVDGGTVSFGSQTFPADGNAGMVICDADSAKRLAGADAPTVQLLSYAEARTKKGYMAMAVVPAAQRAAEKAGVDLKAFAAIKTHNPFAVNDVYFANETGVDQRKVNRYGSPLIYGHPQGPTGLRAIIELIEDLAAQGGGDGLFAGCAAGDTAAALVVRVS